MFRGVRAWKVLMHRGAPGQAGSNPCLLQKTNPTALGVVLKTWVIICQNFETAIIGSLRVAAGQEEQTRALGTEPWCTEAG